MSRTNCAVWTTRQALMMPVIESWLAIAIGNVAVHPALKKADPEHDEHGDQLTGLPDSR